MTTPVYTEEDLKSSIPGDPWVYKDMATKIKYEIEMPAAAERQKVRDARVQEQGKAAAEADEYNRQRACQDSPFPAKTADTLRWALFVKMDIELRANTRSQQFEWRTGQEVEPEDGCPFFGPDWQWNAWQTLTQGAKARLRGEMHKQLDIKFSRDAFNDVLDDLLFDLEVDPLKEYLEGLSPPTGRNILPKMLATCMNVRKGYETLAEWASVYLFLGVVWRCYEPGTKLDEIPILVGPGGIGKSTLPAMAVPQDIPRLCGSGLELNSTTQKMVESILGRALVEIDEMVGVGAGEMSRIKAFLSRLSDDATRLAFKPTTESLPRRCVMVGTADRERFLPNDPNLRRFVPVVLDKGDARRIRTYMAKNRDRLWAEAVVLYRDRVPAHLPHKLKDLAEWAVREAVK